MQQSYDQLIEKWSPVLNESSAGEIKDHHRKAVTAAILENQEKAMSEARQAESGFMTEAAPAGANTGSIGTWDPVLISLVRRAMPNLIAYDVCGVQPMNGPTGLIFAMKSRYGAGSTSSREALFNEAETNFSGVGTHDSDNVSGFNGIAPSGDSADDLRAGGTGTGDTTANMEAYGSSGGAAFEEMGFTIEKQTVTAKSRALKAEYSLELAQDLKAIHGLDAETELANILSTEILAEINREVIRTINSQAKTGCLQANVTKNGIFNLSSDADGRWSAEKFKGLVVQIDRECNVIAKETRRGKGNVVICSSDVATALSASGLLDYSPAMSTQLQVDDTGNTFAGTLNGRIKVYIDPYAQTDYITVGYKGTNTYDSGVFYCPYVPLQMVKAVGEDTFQPKIGFKTRYGMASNPYVGSTPTDGLAAAKSNQYYRIFRVDNILT
ncbi:MAG: ATP-binding protein [Euryarchaeota archaeon]|nr:ATP-binding protein [Euryarchaeota archaeon]